MLTDREITIESRPADSTNRLHLDNTVILGTDGTGFRVSTVRFGFRSRLGYYETVLFHKPGPKLEDDEPIEGGEIGTLNRSFVRRVREARRNHAWAVRSVVALLAQ